MRYQNRQPPEGINVTPEHPLKQFLKLLILAMVLLILLVVALQFSGAWLAKRVPFNVERSLVERMNVPFGDVDASPEMVAYLNELAVKVVGNLPLSDGMSVRVHYSADDVFNAFATIGGNLLFYRGLLERMPHENALAMVVAHEVSHVLHRDPIAGLGGGVASMVAILLLTGQSGTGAAGKFLSTTGGITGMQFTRHMELAADKQALQAIALTYGHVQGADTLFRVIDEQQDNNRVSNWLERFARTHPLDDDRIAAVTDQARAAGWALEGELTPLPEDFHLWLSSAEH